MIQACFLTRGLYSYSVIILCLFCVLQSTTVNGNNSKNICILNNWACKNGRSDKYCPEGQRCVRVKVVVSVTNSSVKCEYVCEPKTAVNISTPLLQSLNDSDSDNTTTVKPVEVTTSWKENPAYCNFNFVCLNGGYCTKEPRTNFTEQRLFCVCLSNYTGPFCQSVCAKQCENNGSCTLVPDPETKNKTEKCNCKPGFSGPECEFVNVLPATKRKEELIWYIPVLIGLAVVSFAALSYVILHKLKWRSLFVTKLFHYLQPYEDDDGKEFDAFVSFRSSNADYSQSEDEKFVLQVLQPMLEKEFRYKICVHYRDFLPGETIANNIIWAVENSRRTILILSPLYIHSEWARMEYQKAQQEMLQLRHKIVPIIFDDISETPIDDPTLKHILSSVTYIHYPKSNEEKAHSKFWQMIALALPKKRSIESESPISSAHPAVSMSTSQTLMSQESWQSSRTDTTDIEMDEVTSDNDLNENNDVTNGIHNDVTNGIHNDVTVDINEADKIRLKQHGNAKLEIAVNNNVDKYISILEAVS